MSAGAVEGAPAPSVVFVVFRGLPGPGLCPNAGSFRNASHDTPSAHPQEQGPPSRNLSSILQRGLLTRKSKGRLPVVWLHAPGKTSWALLHTVRRHGGRVEDVIVFEVNVPARWLRHSPRRGLWYVRRDVPPARLRRLFHFNELAASPLAA
jgi:hypothetical protein